MTTDTSKITGAADELSSGLAKGGSAAKTLGAEIASAIKSLDSRVAALEEGGGSNPNPPDPVPPDGNNTHGEVTGFNAANGSGFKVDGTGVSAQNANKAWSLKNPDKYTLRFEVHQGDRWSSSGGYADSDCERSEIQHGTHFPPGTTFTTEYNFVVEPGPNNSSDWLVLGQWHQTKAGGSPNFSIVFYGDKMNVSVRGPDNRENLIWRDNSNIQRGRKYAMKIELKIDSNNSTGTAKVWRDGTQIADFNGPLGTGVSGESYYWKQGVYRGSCAETLAASYSNLHITG